MVLLPSPHSVPIRYISVFLSFYFANWPELAWTLGGLDHIAMKNRNKSTIFRGSV